MFAVLSRRVAESFREDKWWGGEKDTQSRERERERELMATVFCWLTTVHRVYGDRVEIDKYNR